MALDFVDTGSAVPDPVREYILDMLDQLAGMAAEHGDLASARQLWACWGQVSETNQAVTDAMAQARRSAAATTAPTKR